MPKNIRLRFTLEFKNIRRLDFRNSLEHAVMYVAEDLEHAVMYVAEDLEHAVMYVAEHLEHAG